MHHLPLFSNYLQNGMLVNKKSTFYWVSSVTSQPLYPDPDIYKSNHTREKNGLSIGYAKGNVDRDIDICIF